MDVPDFVVCCSIISRITKKQPLLMQNLFGDMNALGKPKMLLVKLREIGRFEKTSKTISTTATPATTALATNAPAHQGTKRKKPYNPIRCIGDHNPLAGHPPEECWTLHPGILKKKREDQKKATSLHTTATPTEGSSSGIRLSFSYHHDTAESKLQTTILDSGASNHMLTSLSYFT
ncbi:hypothetical protein PTTG_31084, partial [Puccinia triticina 1-1 BBBD Race 1]